MISNLPVGAAGLAPSAAPAKQNFAKVLEAAGRAPAKAAPKTVSPSPAAPAGQTTAHHAAAALDGVAAAQKRLDGVLKLAQSGKTFTPAELLALQANVYRASQELDLAGKLIEKASSGVKQVLQTQL